MVPEPPVVPEPPAIPEPPTAPSLPTYRVRSGANEARAFVYRDARHLVTTANVVADRGSLRLVTDDGAAPDGARLEVVAVEGGLALLRADVDLGTPATLGTVEVGERVRRDETVALALTMDEQRLRTSEICVVGAPLTNERGELVAVCTSRTDARLASQLDALWESTSGAPSRWRGRLTIGFDYRVRQDFEPVLGGEVGFGVLGYDRFGFLVRTAFFQNAKSDDESIRLRSAFEIGAEVQLQHAFRFGALPIRLGLGLGATYRPVKERRIQELLEIEPGCDPSAGPCAATYTRTRTDSDTDHRVLPTARFGVAFGGLAFAYTAAIDVDEPKRTTHTLTIGTGL
ncbi:MAG: hypothetical protein R3B99_34875 [Polyangiales bacterium]